MKNQIYYLIAAVVFIATVSLFYAFIVAPSKNLVSYSAQSSAIKECERSLPRDQECEIIIAAKVKEK